MLFGLPSLRIKGFYLVVATLAAQFFLQWTFTRVPWLYNYNVSGAIEAPTRTLFGIPILGANATPQTRYLLVLTLVVALTWLAANLVHGRIGRMWMAVRDMDIAAELMGIRLLPTKLLAFAVSSYVCGVAGALCARLARRRGVQRLRHQPVLSHPVHGHHWRAGKPIGSFLGAALIFTLPILLGQLLPAFSGRSASISALRRSSTCA